MKLSTILLRPFALSASFALIAALFFGSQVYAADEGSHNLHSDEAVLADGVTLDEFIAIGLRDNPSIRARRAALKSRAQKFFRVRSLDDPMVTYIQPIQEIETRLGPNKRSLMLSQKFPYPGKRKLKGAIAKKEAELAGIALDSVARKVVFDIKTAYYDIYFLDMAVELAGEKITVFEHFTKAEMNDYSVGVAGLSDVVSAETRYADAEYDLVLFEELRRGKAGMLNALLNRSPDEHVGLVAELEVESMEDYKELNELYDLARNSEIIKGASLKVEKGQLTEDLSDLAGKPNFIFGLKYTEIGEPQMGGINDGGRDAFALTLGMTLPIWAGKNKATRAEARLARVESEYALAALSNGIDAMVKKAYVDMRSSYKLLKLYSDSLLPKADKLNETARIMYKNGKGSIADIFEVRSMVIDFTLAYHRAASNYMKSRAELERLTAGFALKEVAIND